MRKKVDRKHLTITEIKSAYISNCRRKNIYFELSREDIESLVFLNCYYCGKEPSNMARKGKDLIPYSGIDRLDTNAGYILKNCVPCCIECNGIKSNKFTPEETKIMVDALIVSRNGKPH